MRKFCSHGWPGQSVRCLLLFLVCVLVVPALLVQIWLDRQQYPIHSSKELRDNVEMAAPVRAEVAYGAALMLAVALAGLGLAVANRPAGYSDKELERQRSWLEATLENTDAHLVFLDRDFNFLRVNKAYATACRREPADFLGHNHFEFFPHEENEAIFRRVRDTGEPFSIQEKPFEFPDMPERGITYRDWTLVPIKSETGRVENLVFSLTDVTEKVRQRERLVAAERARTELLETLNQEIAHRTKNNLAIVAGLLQRQIDRRDSADTNPISDAVARLMSLSAIHEQMYQRQSADTVEMLDVLRRIADVNRHALSSGEVAISVEGEPVECPANIATNLCVVANELMTNAIKHADPRDGRVRVEVHFGREDGRLALSVWNSHSSIASDFDVKAQGKTGLGLVRAIVEKEYRGVFTLAPERGGTMARILLEATHRLPART